VPADRVHVRFAPSSERLQLQGRAEPGLGRRRTVLVADDEAHLVEVIRATLTSEGYRVIAARDGDHAWELICRDRPDAAILDVKMPGRDGVELLHAVRADPTLAVMPVVLLTAQDDDDQIWRGWQAGAASYITKPFNFEVLIQHLRAVLDG
jgi:two-component system, OmpR family, response regulator MprA